MDFVIGCDYAIVVAMMMTKKRKRMKRMKN
jgi:hypothetical protein